jgi:hypothetical protein
MKIELKEFIEYLEDIGDSQAVFNSPVKVDFSEKDSQFSFRIWKDGLLIYGLSGHKNEGWEKSIINRTMASMFAGFVQFVENTQKEREGNEN